MNGAISKREVRAAMANNVAPRSAASTARAADTPISAPIAIANARLAVLGVSHEATHALRQGLAKT